VSLRVPVGSEDHAQGASEAPLTLVEYGDYQCGHCGRAHPAVKALQKRFGSGLRFVFRNMPLVRTHPEAQLAAEAAEAAGAQGRFWEMHEALYENQHSLGPELIREQARRIGLDMERFEKDLAEHRFRKRVREDFMGGVRSGVNGTPTFFINGERYDGDPENEEELASALEQKLKH
jgi:protein-disulfide isomerase